MRFCRALLFAVFIALLLSFFSGCKKEEPAPVLTPTPATPTPTAEPVSAPVYTPPPTPTPLGFPTMGYINSEGVNMRADPSQEAAIVDIMGENAVLSIVSLHDGWYRVDLNGQTVYVSERLVTIGDPPRKHNMHWAKVAKKEAPLYKTPDTKEPSTVKLQKDEVVKVLRKLGDYLHVVYGGNLQRYIKESDIAYISEEEFLVAFSAAASASPTPKQE